MNPQESQKLNLNCQESQKLFDGYIDGELDLVKNLEIEQHLKDCPSCARAKKNLLELRSAFADESFYFKPSTQFQKRIRVALREAEKAEKRETKADGFSWLLAKNWLGIAAALIVVALLTFTLARVFSRPSTDELLTQEIVASHVRSLMVDHMTDVPSSDQHTVKPWFNGKIDFSPPVEDFASQGFALVGGRLDYINNKPVAALVYQRRQHLINLFIWQQSRATEMQKEYLTRQGYNLIHWSKDDMTYWIVSDLNGGELEEFARLLNK